MKPKFNPTTTAYTYAGNTIRPEQLAQAIANYKFEEEIKDYDVLYDILNETIVKYQPFPVERMNDMQYFRAQIARFVYNEYLDTEHTSLQHFVDKGLVEIPQSVSTAEQELISIIINKTRGTESNDDILGVLIRVLSFLYIYTEYAIPPVIFMSSALSIKTTQGLRDFIAWITTKKKLIKIEESNIEDIEDMVTTTDDVKDAMQEVNKQVEGAMFDAKTIAQAMNKAIEDDVKNLHKAASQVREETSSSSSISSESSGGGSSSSSSSWGWGDVALTAAGIAVVGVGAYYIASNFLGSQDDDIELLPVREL